MKLETILAAMQEWNLRNDLYEDVMPILAESAYFEIDPIVTFGANPNGYIHAYPGIIEDKLFFFLIADVYEKTIEIDGSKNIFAAECKYLDKNDFGKLANAISPDKGKTEEYKNRIYQWNLCKEDYVKRQINTFGLFEVFGIPVGDLLGAGEEKIYAFLGAQKEKVESFTEFRSDLIIMHHTEEMEKGKFLCTGVNDTNGEGLYDTVFLCPPFGQDGEGDNIESFTDNPKNYANFRLLQLSLETQFELLDELDVD